MRTKNTRLSQAQQSLIYALLRSSSRIMEKVTGGWGIVGDISREEAWDWNVVMSLERRKILMIGDTVDRYELDVPPWMAPDTIEQLFGYAAGRDESL